MPNTLDLGTLAKHPNKSVEITSIEDSIGGNCRLILDAEPEFRALLQQLTRDTSKTESQLIQEAIALMQLAVEARQSGKKLGIVDSYTLTLITEIIGV